MKTAAEYLAQMVSLYEAATGAVLDIERDLVIVPIFAAQAAQLAEIDEALQASRDQLDPAQATGFALDKLAQLIGMQREAATRSLATVTFTGTPGTVIPSGALVTGGGEDGRARWELLANATIGAGGTADAIVRAVETGRIQAGAGEINRLFSVISGLNSVINADAAEPGQPLEDDQTLRSRRLRRLTQLAGRSCAAIRAAAEALPGVQSALVFDNPSNSSVVRATLTLPPHSFAVVVHPAQVATEDRQALASMIYERRSPGVETVGAQQMSVSAPRVDDVIIRWTHATLVDVDVDVTLELAPGVTLGSVEDAVEDAVRAVIEATAVGGKVRRLAILSSLAAIDGVVNATLLIDGVDADFALTEIQKAAPGAITSGI